MHIYMIKTIKYTNINMTNIFRNHHYTIKKRLLTLTKSQLTHEMQQQNPDSTILS